MLKPFNTSPSDEPGRSPNTTTLILQTPTNSTTQAQAIIQYDSRVSLLLDEVERVKKNKLAESTRDQYRAANVSCIIFLFTNFSHIFHEDFVIKYANFTENCTSSRQLTRAIANSLGDNNICPFAVNKFEAKMFLAYLVHLKHSDGSYYSTSYYETKKSAFLNLIEESGNELAPEIIKEFNLTIISLKKTIASYNAKHGIKPAEGKDHMSFQCYRLTCQLLVEDGSAEAVSALAFLTLQWNLIARAETVGLINFSQLYWEDDHLKIFFPKHKSDQIGLTKDEARHIYSNPLMPEVCPIRALAAYALTFPQVFRDGKKIFPGEASHNRFDQEFKRIMELHDNDYLNINVVYSDLGTHSIRKGGATYCCAGVHPGPPVISVCLRAGWTIGRVKERYLKYENAGDELVGRTLTGIPPTSVDFGISHVYFKSDSRYYQQIEEFLSVCFSVILPKLTGFSRVLLASFIYHESWTRENQHPASPLFNSTYYSFDIVYPNRKDFVSTALPWENKHDAPVLTGIPIHCSLLNKIMEIYEMQKALPEEMLKRFVQELDQRNIGNGSVNANRIIERIEQSNQDLKESLLHHLGDPKPKEHDEALVINEAVLNSNGNDSSSRTSEHRPASVPLLSSADGVWAHFWGGKVRALPYDFRFPKRQTLYSLWMNWHLPNISKKICPYKILRANDVGHICRGQNKLLEMRMVVQVMINKLMENTDLYDIYQSGCKNFHTLGDIYDKVKHVFLDRMTDKKKSRFGQLSWETFVREARSIKMNAPIQPRPVITMDANEQVRTSTRKAQHSSNVPIQPRPVITMDANEQVRTPTRKAQHSSNVQHKNIQNQVPPSTSPNPATKTLLSQFGIVSPDKPTPQRRKQPSIKRNNRKRIAKKRTSTRYVTSKSTSSKSAQQQKSTSSTRQYTSRKKRTQINKSSSVGLFDKEFKQKTTITNKATEKELELNENGHFKSILCTTCSKLPTQHRCQFELKDGFSHNGRTICGIAVCPNCCTSEGVWRCRYHA